LETSEYAARGQKMPFMDGHLTATRIPRHTTARIHIATAGVDHKATLTAVVIAAVGFFGDIF
jgi:hypothetical protein